MKSWTQDLYFTIRKKVSFVKLLYKKERRKPNLFSSFSTLISQDLRLKAEFSLGILLKELDYSHQHFLYFRSRRQAA